MGKLGSNMIVSQDVIQKELSKSVTRKRKARLSNLEKRIEKNYPLFYDELIERTINEHSEYYHFQPSEYDRQILEFRLARRIDPDVDINNYVDDDYETSSISQSYSAMKYRELVKKVMKPLDFIKAVSIQFYSYRNKPVYRADYWYQIALKCGYNRFQLLGKKS